MASTRQQKKTEDGDQLHQAVKSAVSKLCTSEAFITQLSESIFSSINEKINKELEFLKNKINELELTVHKQDGIIKSLKDSHEKYEKFTRKNNFLVYGLVEQDNENCLATMLDVLNTQMRLNIEETSIESCFRLGKVNKTKSRPLLVKCNSGHLRRLILSNRKFLKGTKIVIREDLTAVQMSIFKSALGKVGKNGKVWTNFGATYLKYSGDETVHKIATMEDIHGI